MAVAVALLLMLFLFFVVDYNVKVFFNVLGGVITNFHAENDSCYYGLSLLWNYRHFRGSLGNNFIFLTLDKEDTMNFSFNIIPENCRLLLTFCQNTLQKTSEIFIFSSIPSVSSCTTWLRFSLQLVPFHSRLYRRDQTLIHYDRPSFPTTA